eukprot:Nitzschia sp. Nitz4//scaffold28_size193895//134169//135370//NITZ4_001674-RA/size193895-exonerate_est2genome-gene-0.135-mRNA-1//-1//CDS//3329546009//713//frame0
MNKTTTLLSPTICELPQQTVRPSITVAMKWRSTQSVLVGLLLVSLYVLLSSSLQLVHLTLPTSDLSSVHRQSDNVSCDNSRKPASNSIPTNTTVSGFTYPPYVFGLVHMAKTAGTYINSYLAANYERVCGNKGNSFNIASRYRLVRETAESLLRQNKTPCYNLKCKFGKNKEPFQPAGENQKQGFEDCDYIALEQQPYVWGELAQTLSESPLSDSDKEIPSSDTHPVQIQLHVPCRDPIDHLLSQCNHRRRKFECTPNATIWQTTIDNCMVEPKRFRYESWSENPLLQVKCFSDSQVPSYLEYMSGMLQPRRRKVVDYVNLSSNRARKKSKECLLSDDTLAREVRAYMMKTYPYYRWCQDCLSGPDNLLSHHIQ